MKDIILAYRIKTLKNQTDRLNSLDLKTKKFRIFLIKTLKRFRIK